MPMGRASDRRRLQVAALAGTGEFMEAWKEDQMNALFTEQSADSRFDQAVNLAANLGFDRCAYGIRVTRSYVNPEIRMFNNYSRAWQTRYRDRGYLDVDPSVRHGLVSLSPYVWPTRDRPGVHEEFWSEARLHGLRTGISIPVVAHNGIRGMFTVTRSDNDSDPHSLAKLEWLSSMVHQSMAIALVRDSAGAGAELLTCRELEILRWVADGATSCEIADALNISDCTVNFHLKAAIAKLKVPNRTAAAVLVMRLGLIG